MINKQENYNFLFCNMSNIFLLGPVFLVHFIVTALRHLSRCLSLLLRRSKSNSVVSAKCFGVNSTFINFVFVFQLNKKVKLAPKIISCIQVFGSLVWHRIVSTNRLTKL